MHHWWFHKNQNACVLPAVRSCLHCDDMRLCKHTVSSIMLSTFALNIVIDIEIPRHTRRKTNRDDIGKWKTRANSLVKYFLFLSTQQHIVFDEHYLVDLSVFIANENASLSYQERIIVEINLNALRQFYMNPFCLSVL